MTWREIEADQLAKLRRPILIDVRSPCEFAAERIPGAINIPLLDDEERATVGTIYANEGEVTARRRALSLISPKITAIVDSILALKSRDSALVVHCWRGGLRCWRGCRVSRMLSLEARRPIAGGWRLRI